MSLYFNRFNLNLQLHVIQNCLRYEMTMRFKIAFMIQNHEQSNISKIVMQYITAIPIVDIVLNWA